MGFFERMGLKLLWPYFNRGPYPAPGDHFTLNVAGYTMGGDFDTWLIPSMRLIVDFSREEPMVAVNSSGQSDNPSSPHYADGIELWREGRYIAFPFKEAAVNAQYQQVLMLRPSSE
jgi:acyl-homoserine-lactone acylase